MKRVVLLIIFCAGLYGWSASYYVPEKIVSFDSEVTDIIASESIGNMLFLMGKNTLHVYDILDLHNLEKIKDIELPLTLERIYTNREYKLFYNDTHLFFYYWEEDETSTILIFNVSDAENIFLERTYEYRIEPDPNIYYVFNNYSPIFAVDENYVYQYISASSGGGVSGIRILDVSDPQNIVEAKRFEFSVRDGRAFSFYLQNGYIVLFDGELMIYEENNDQLSLIKSFDSIYFRETDLYIIDGGHFSQDSHIFMWSERGTLIIDFSDPLNTQIQLLSLDEYNLEHRINDTIYIVYDEYTGNSIISEHNGNDDFIKKGEISDSRFINQVGNGVIFENSSGLDLYQLDKRDTFDLTKTSEWGKSAYTDIQISGNHAFVLQSERNENHIIDILDITDPEHVVSIGSKIFDEHVSSIFVLEDMLYVPQMGNLEIFNISDISNIQKINEIQLIELEQTYFTHDCVFSRDNNNLYVFLEGDHADDYIYHIDIATPADPVIINQFDAHYEMDTACYQNEYMFYCDHESTIGGLDFINLVVSKITEEGIEQVFVENVFNANAAVNKLVINEGYLYLIFNGLTREMKIYSLDNPELPQYVASVSNLPYLNDIHFMENICIGVGEKMVLIDLYDISAPALITQYGEWDKYAEKIELVGTTAFVTCGYDGLRTVDLTDEENPVELGIFDLSGELEHISFSDDRIFLSDGHIQILESIGGQLTRLGTINKDHKIQKILADDTYVYAVVSNDGLYRFDVSDLDNISNQRILSYVVDNRDDSFFEKHDLCKNGGNLFHSENRWTTADGPHSTLHWMNIDEDNNIEHLSELKFENTYIQDIEMLGDTILMMKYSYGTYTLIALETDDAEGLKIIGEWNPGGFQNMHVVNSYLLLMEDRNDSYYVMDTSDFSNMSWEFVDYNFPGYQSSIAAYDHYMFMNQNNVTQIYDISDIYQPSFRQELKVSDSYKSLIGIHNNMLYNAGHRSGVLSEYLISSEQLQITDLIFSPIDRQDFLNPVTVQIEGVVNIEEGVSINSYHWDFDGDGIIDEVTSANSVAHEFAFAGTYPVTLTCEDSEGSFSLPYTKDLTVLEDPAPSIPENFRGFFSGDSDINLYWNASTDNEGVKYYAIYRGEDNSLVGTTGDTHYTVNGVSHSELHRFKLKAFDYYGNASSFSPEAVVIPENYDTEAPSVPQIFVGVGISDSEIHLSWQPSTDNIGVRFYAIYRSEDNSLVGTTPYTSYVVRGLEQYVTYRYKIKAFDYADNRSAFSKELQARTQVPDPEAPSVPLNLTAAGSSSTDIIVRWESSTDNVGVRFYAVYRYEDSVLLGTSYSNEFTLSGLEENTTYSFRIKAFDFNNNRSGFSNTVSCQTLKPDNIAPSAPSELTGEVVSATQVNLSWTASTDDQGVRFYAVYEGESNTLIGTTWLTEYKVNNLTANTEYTFKVKAFDFNNNRSTFSNECIILTDN